MYPRPLALALLVAPLLAACPGTTPAVEPDTPPAHAEPLTSTAPPCEGAIQLSIVFDPDTRRFTALAHNNTSAPIDLQLPDHCPSGPIHFTGLPGGYDAYSTCAMGDCPERPPTYTLTLPPGAPTTLATGAITEGPCNEPLPPGRYTIAFALPDNATQATVCPPTPVSFER